MNDDRRSRVGAPVARRGAPPGVDALLLAALSIGIILLAIQLWLLTVALETYLAGDDDHLWILALCSGLVFVGGLAAIRVIARRWPAAQR